ncbi:MAG: glutaminase A [Cyanothece sp. SIO2G6]|nr:glutaminase A [Cyanothece sp. SIO2G6]
MPRSWNLTQSQINDWVRQSQYQAKSGWVPTYISHLEHAHPSWFAVQIITLDGQDYQGGRSGVTFSLMSVVKPFMLLYLLECLGPQAVFGRVGMQPSDQPFNSIAQLKQDQGHPRNPMLNSGAIALASLLPGATGIDRCTAFCQWLDDHAGTALKLDQTVLASVRQLPNERNRAIARHLAQSNHLKGEVQATLDAYEQVCCISATVKTLARLGMLMVDRSLGIHPAHQRIVTTIMSTCGLYEESANFAVTIGLPCKSGVSGAILAIVPGQGAIACYSPPLNAAGNSVGGLFFLEQLSHALDLSIFT